MPMPKRTAASAFGAPTNIIIPDKARIGSPSFLNIFFNISNLPGRLTPVAFHYIGRDGWVPVAVAASINEPLAFRPLFAYDYQSSSFSLPRILDENQRVHITRVRPRDGKHPQSAGARAFRQILLET